MDWVIRKVTVVCWWQVSAKSFHHLKNAYFSLAHCRRRSHSLVFSIGLTGKQQCPLDGSRVKLCARAAWPRLRTLGPIHPKSRVPLPLSLVEVWRMPREIPPNTLCVARTGDANSGVLTCILVHGWPVSRMQVGQVPQPKALITHELMLSQNVSMDVDSRFSH